MQASNFPGPGAPLCMTFYNAWFYSEIFYICVDGHKAKECELEIWNDGGFQRRNFYIERSPSPRNRLNKEESKSGNAILLVKKYLSTKPFDLVMSLNDKRGKGLIEKKELKKVRLKILIEVNPKLARR